MDYSTITLNTKLADIGYDNADAINDELIDTTIVGDDWGWAWDRVTRHNPGATVEDLRDTLTDNA